MSDGRKREFVRGYVSSLCSSYRRCAADSVRRAENPKRVFASRCSDVRSYSSGGFSLRLVFSSLVISPRPSRTASTIAAASSAVASRGCDPAW